jgi:hypothetical protein
VPEESLGGETNPRKEQKIRELQHTTGSYWTRRWSKTLKSAGPERRARRTDGEGATGAAREREDPPRPEDPSKTECSVPRRGREVAPENGGRTATERSVSVATPATRPPRGGRGSRRAPSPEATNGAIRSGAQSPRGEPEWGAASPARANPRGGADARDSTRSRRCSSPLSRATGGSGHRTPPGGKSSGPSADRGRNATSDGDGAERAARGLRSARNEADTTSESPRWRR